MINLHNIQSSSFTDIEQACIFKFRSFPNVREMRVVNGIPEYLTFGITWKKIRYIENKSWIEDALRMWINAGRPVMVIK